MAKPGWPVFHTLHLSRSTFRPYNSLTQNWNACRIDCVEWGGERTMLVVHLCYVWCSFVSLAQLSNPTILSLRIETSWGSIDRVKGGVNEQFWLYTLLCLGSSASLAQLLNPIVLLLIIEMPGGSIEQSRRRRGWTNNVDYQIVHLCCVSGWVLYIDASNWLVMQLCCVWR